MYRVQIQGAIKIILNEHLIFISYHNIDIQYAFQLSTLLIRYYRNIWLDRFEIGPTEDWDEKIRQARGRVSGAIVIVSDDYLQSDYCRREYDHFQNRQIPITAVIPRDFSTDRIAGFTFDDWIDFRRWFIDPNDHSVENLLGRIPQSELVQQTGERLDYLRNFIQTLELQLSRMPTSRALLYGSGGQDSSSIRPRAYQTSLLNSWDFSNSTSEETQAVEDLLSWSREHPQFILRGQVGSGKTAFARLLALASAHAAMRAAAAPLPVWLDLMKWDDQQSAEDYIESQWGLVSYWKHWLESRQALFVLDNWNDLAQLHPRRAAELTNWIAANPKHRLMLLSTNAAAADPELPILQISPMSGQLALKFSSGFLTLEQQSAFRQMIRSQQPRIENNHVDYLSIGIELLAADKRLAISDWHKNPLPALLSQRRRQTRPTVGAELEADKLLTDLQTLAWHIMRQESWRFVARSDAEQVIDAQVIDAALEIGLLSQADRRLRFQSEMFQWYLAADNLKNAELDQHLPRPQFTSSGVRIQQKWDHPVHTLVDAAAEEDRLIIINRVAAIDPFLANKCLQRHPDLYGSCQETLTARLVESSAQNPASRPAFRAVLHGIPNPHKTVEALASQLPRFDNDIRLWLWHELLALPIHLPVEFVNGVANINRESSAAADLLAAVALPLAAACLAKLSRQPNDPIRSNAIWMLGEIQYPAAAVFLLDCLQDSPTHADEIIRALMQYTDSATFIGLLQWLQDHPAHTAQVAMAMNQRRHYVSGRLLSMAHEGHITLHPRMAEIMANDDEVDIAIGLAMIATQSVELPPLLTEAIAAKDHADQLQKRIAAGIRHLPDRDGFQQLLDDIAQVIQDPPETIARETQAAQTLAEDSAVDSAPPPATEDTPAESLEPPYDGSPAIDDDPLDDDAQPEKSSRAFTDEEKLRRTLELLRHDRWGKTQKAAQFLRRFAKHLRGAENPNIIRLLCQALRDKSWHVRWAVAEALAWLRHPDAIPSLRSCLHDPSWIVQAAVIRSLVELDAKESAADIARLLQSRRKAVREAAAEALGALQNPDVIPALGQTLKNDPDYFVRFAAIQSIHQISPSESREYLDYALTDRYIHVRWYAMKTLAPIMDASDIPLLARMAADRGKPLWEEESIQDFAILALQRINTPESRALLEHIRKAEKRNDS